jgi:hypothetical protein
MQGPLERPAPSWQHYARVRLEEQMRRIPQLIAAHLLVLLASPGVASFITLVMTDMRSSFHFGGVLAIAFGVVLGYVFFAVQTLLLVVCASPICWVLARVKRSSYGFALALSFGFASGWLFAHLTFQQESYALNARTACAITGALASAVLQSAWRRAISSGSSGSSGESSDEEGERRC